ncbi:MAG: hypothetical protein AMJ69_12755, partial [Gammaproteobacteria bacterium SG8_47]
MADAKVLVEFEVDAGGAIKAVRQFKKETGTIPESTEKARRGLINLRNVLAGLGAYFSIRTITQFGRAIIQTGAQFETMGIQLRAVTGSVEDANRAMDWITQFTADTPYQLEQVTGAFIKLRAMGLDPMDGTMQAVADMTSYLGGSMDVMNSIVLALGKSFTVGKMTMEEMRMLMERGVPVIDILADKLGVTNERILEMSQRGQLGRDAIGLLIEGMQELAGGASQRLMDSWAGLWSNLQDHITLALKELSEGGALDGAKEGLRSLVDGMKDLRESGRLQEWGADLGEMLAKTGEFIAKLIEDLPRVIEHATNLAKTFVLLFAAERVETFVKWVVKLRKEMVLTGTAAWGLHAALAAIVGLGLAEWFDTWNRKLEGPSARAIGAFQRAVKDAGMSVDGLLASFPEAVDKTEAWRMAFERFIRDTKGGSEATGQWVRVAALYNAEVKDAADVTVKASDAARDHADAIDGEALAVNAAADAVKKLISETKQATFEAEQLYFATDQLIRHLHAQEDAVETVAQSLDEFIQGMSMDWTMGLSGMEGPTSEWAEVTQNTFSDLLGKGFMGE